MQPVVICGWHAVLAALERSPERVLQVWLDERRAGPRAATLLAIARDTGISVQSVPRTTLDALAAGGHHQGVVAQCRPGEARGDPDLEEFLAGVAGPAFLLVLDGVQDPHNLGACLRSADGAGAHAVVLPRDNAVGLTPTVRKVASGAAENVPVFQVTNLARALDRLKDTGIWVVGAAGEATQELFTADLRGPLALVLGGEGKGLRRLTRERCDFLVRIPMAGSVASLNVSVAAAVCMFEAVRQRRLDRAR